jgi:hypothetical protein
VLAETIAKIRPWRGTKTRAAQAARQVRRVMEVELSGRSSRN